MQQQLRLLIESGDVSKVKQCLSDHPDFNINEILNGINNFTALHVACWNGHHEIVSILLANHDTNVNQKTNEGYTPFLLPCYHGHVEVVKLLLKDSCVNVNMADKKGCTPLWHASYEGHVGVIKWIIAMRGDEMKDLDKKGEDWDDKEYTAIEIARERNKREVVSLLDRFVANPTQTRHETSLELGLVDAMSYELFGMTVFLCDDLLKLRKPEASSSAPRFFNIITKLPMELQMILCYRVFGSAKQNMKSKDSEAAFKHVAQVFSR